MRHRGPTLAVLVWSLAVLVLTGACATDTSPDADAVRTTNEDDQVETAPEERSEVKGLVVAGRIPSKPGPLARELARVDGELKVRLDEWIPSELGRKGDKWKTLERLGLRAQKIYRKLVVHPRRARRVEERVGKALAWKIHANVRAGRGLRALTTPLEPPIELKTKRPASPRKLLTFYKEAKRRFGIPWRILASLNFVESKFGRINGPSSAGAMGPMQFMPATWDAYGRGNIMDPHDSIMAAARYLKASGAPQRMRSALYAYNHSWAYVDAIQIYARQIKADTRNYFGYYLYQVFVRTTDGDLQLTGPGADA